MPASNTASSASSSPARSQQIRSYLPGGIRIDRGAVADQDDPLGNRAVGVLRACNVDQTLFPRLVPQKNRDTCPSLSSHTETPMRRPAAPRRRAGRPVSSAPRRCERSRARCQYVRHCAGTVGGGTFRAMRLTVCEPVGWVLGCGWYRCLLSVIGSRRRIGADGASSGVIT
jgi:hypothetical protein